MHAGDPTHWISHKTITAAIYARPRVALKQGMVDALRQARPTSSRPQKTPPERGLVYLAWTRGDAGEQSYGARERTRTSTELPPLAPEASASTNSATRANPHVAAVRGAYVAMRRSACQRMGITI